MSMGTNCAHIVADLFNFIYLFIFLSLFVMKEVLCLFLMIKKKKRYLDGLLYIDNFYFEVYSNRLQLNKANSTDTEATFLHLHLLIFNSNISSKIYDKRDDYDFDIFNFLFLDGDLPRVPSYGVYSSQLIRFARVFSHLGRPWWLSWMRTCLVIRRLRVRPPSGRQHSFAEIDHEIFPTIILSLPLIQEGQLSMSGERMCTILVNRLED